MPAGAGEGRYVLEGLDPLPGIGQHVEDEHRGDQDEPGPFGAGPAEVVVRAEALGCQARQAVVGDVGAAAAAVVQDAFDARRACEVPGYRPGGRRRRLASGSSRSCGADTPAVAKVVAATRRGVPTADLQVCLAQAKMRSYSTSAGSCSGTRGGVMSSAALAGGGVEEATEFFGQDRVAVGVPAPDGDGAGPQVTAGLRERAHHDRVGQYERSTPHSRRNASRTVAGRAPSTSNHSPTDRSSTCRPPSPLSSLRVRW